MYDFPKVVRIFLDILKGQKNFERTQCDQNSINFEWIWYAAQENFEKSSALWRTESVEKKTWNLIFGKLSHFC